MITWTDDMRERYHALRESTERINSYVKLAQHCFQDAEFAPPVSPKVIDEAERLLKHSFPSELRSLWLESNGIRANGGYSIVYSVEECIRENTSYRDEHDLCDFYMSFDSLFVFGEIGTGDLFFFPIQWDGRIRSDAVFHFDHEIDSRTYFTHSVRDLFLHYAFGIV